MDNYPVSMSLLAFYVFST